MPRKLNPDLQRNEALQEIVTVMGSQQALVDRLRELRPDQTWHQSYVDAWLQGHRPMSIEHASGVLTVARQNGLGTTLADLNPDAAKHVATIMDLHRPEVA